MEVVFCFCDVGELWFEVVGVGVVFYLVDGDFVFLVDVGLWVWVDVVGEGFFY